MRARQATAFALIWTCLVARPTTAPAQSPPPTASDPGTRKAAKSAPRAATKPAQTPPARSKPTGSGTAPVDGSVRRVGTQDPPPTTPSAAPAPAQTLPTLPADSDQNAASPAVDAAPPPIAPSTPEQMKQARAEVESRLKGFDAPEAKDNPANKPIVEALQKRVGLFGAWEKAFKEHESFEHPRDTPEQASAEQKDVIEKTRLLLDQANKNPEPLLPEAFQARPDAEAKPVAVRLAEMKEAIDAARSDVKERAAELEASKAEAAKLKSDEPSTLRAARDKAQQALAAASAGRAEREAAVGSASSPEAAELARERLANFEWEYRTHAEQLAAVEAQISLATRRADMLTYKVQARTVRAELAARLLAEMERRYSGQAERQQVELKRALVKEESRAARTVDVLERYRAKRNAELLELESQVVAHEKTLATRGEVSATDEKAMADRASTFFADLKKKIEDGNVSQLDVLLLRNEFRRIGPERARIVDNDLAVARRESTTFENALADAEINLINDERDDRLGRDSLLEQLPATRRAEADRILDAIEVRHRDLLLRSKTVLEKLAQRADDAQREILRRIDILDQEYTFIRTHIFWVRNAEPIGGQTVAHAREESARAARAISKLAAETTDRSLWGKTSVDFMAAVVGLVLLPWPLRLGQKVLDRRRLAEADPSITPANAPSAVVVPR